jgi:hypothetical protein
LPSAKQLAKSSGKFLSSESRVSEISTYLVSIEICALFGVLFAAKTCAHGPHKADNSAALKSILLAAPK